MEFEVGQSEDMNMRQADIERMSVKYKHFMYEVRHSSCSMVLIGGSMQ